MTSISIKQVKTRAPHKCWGCGESFPIGSMLERQTEAAIGQIWHIYWCDDCRDYISSQPDWSSDDSLSCGELEKDEEYIKFKQYRKVPSDRP